MQAYWPPLRPRPSSNASRRWRVGGTTALASRGAGGAVCRLSAAQLARLRAELDKGPAVHGWAEDQRWTLERVTTLIGRLFHVRYTLCGTSYRALRAGTVPAEVTTDRAPAYLRVLDELIPSALHTVDRYANNPSEADHGRLKARLRPMRGLKRPCSARILAAGHAFVQNLHRGHYELATDVPARHRLREAFDQLAMAI